MSELRRLMMAKKVHTSPLPSGYTECEYLVSTGTQYINTGIAFTNSDTKSFSAIVSRDTKDNTDRGFGVAVTGGLHFVFDEGYRIRTGGGNTSTAPTYEIGQKYNIKAFYDSSKRRCITIDEERNYIGSAYSASQANLLLFALQTSSGKWVGKCYAAFVEDANGNKVADFIPSLNPQGRPCMYDIVRKTPYYNIGSGEFQYKLK